MNQRTTTHPWLVVLALVAAVGLGTAMASRQQTPTQQRGRFSLETETLAGGLGGAMMSVTDHHENVTYMYVMDGKLSEGALPELKGVIDLKTAGAKTLTMQAPD